MAAIRHWYSPALQHSRHEVNVAVVPVSHPMSVTNQTFGKNFDPNFLEMGLAVRYRIQRSLSLSSVFGALCSVASATIGANVPPETPSTSGYSQPRPRGIAGVSDSVPRTIIVHDVKEPIHVLHYDPKFRTLSQELHKDYYLRIPFEESCPPKNEVYENVIRDALDGFKRRQGVAWIGREGTTDKVLLRFENLTDLPSRSTLEAIFPSKLLESYFRECTPGLIPLVDVSTSGALSIHLLEQTELLRRLFDAVVLKVNVFSSLESNDTFGLPESVLKRMKDLKAINFTTLKFIRAVDNSFTCLLKSKNISLLIKSLYGKYLLEWYCDDFEGLADVRGPDWALCVDPERNRSIDVHFVPSETDDPFYQPTEEDFKSAISKDELERIFRLYRFAQIELQRNGEHIVSPVDPSLIREQVNPLTHGHYPPEASRPEESQGDSDSGSDTEESMDFSVTTSQTDA